MSVSDAARELRRTGKAQLIGDAACSFDEASFVRLRQPTIPRSPAGPGAGAGPGFSGGFGAFELARVRIPRGSIGVVRLIWQWVESNVVGAPPLGPVIDIPGVEVTWSLVLEAGDVKQAQLRAVADVMDPQPPKERLPPYGAWSDVRHPWGSHEQIKVFVPEASTISLWVRVMARGGEIRRVGGRLLGYTQSGDSAHAVENQVQGF